MGAQRLRDQRNLEGEGVEQEARAFVQMKASKQESSEVFCPDWFPRAKFVCILFCFLIFLVLKNNPLLFVLFFEVLEIEPCMC